MSVSIDVRQLELLSQFVGFIDALQDVQKIKGLLQDAKDILAQKQELLGAEATKEGADKYAAEVQAKIDALKASVEEEMKQHQTYMSLEKDKINKINSDLNTRQKENDDLRTKLVADSRDAESFKKLAQEELAAAQKARQDAEKANAEAQSLKNELEAKAEQLKKVLG